MKYELCKHRDICKLLVAVETGHNAAGEIGRGEFSRTAIGLRRNCWPLSIRRLPGVMELPGGALFASQGWFARRADDATAYQRFSAHNGRHTDVKSICCAFPSLGCRDGATLH
eukprot:scaffold139046_cov20-Prasinocladus_malaysianus.AAC.1